MTTPDQSHQAPGDELPPPTGTLFVMISYLVVLAVLWGLMFWGLLNR